MVNEKVPSNIERKSWQAEIEITKQETQLIEKNNVRLNFL